MSTKPFQISIGHNKEMGAWEISVQVGNLKDKQEAEQVADALAEWITEESGWKQRVS